MSGQGWWRVADGRTHAAVGTIAGGIAALHSAQNEEFCAGMVEVLGGMFGGRLGGVAPDRVEPAISPRHRGPAHSMVAAVALLLLPVEDGQRQCREQAAMCAAKVLDPTLPPATRLFYALAELFWRFLAGVLTGFRAGYGSHLVLDGRTPMGLPLIGR